MRDPSDFHYKLTGIVDFEGWGVREQKAVDVMYLYFSKVFDRVSNYILTNKQKKSTVKWIHGSILGPVFINMINGFA